MVRHKKRKLKAIGVKPIGGNIVKSRKKARQITSKYHAILKRKQILLEQERNTNEKEDISRQLEDLENELFQIGGIDSYQEASVISTNHFKTSKWIIQALRRLNKFPSSNLKRLDCLEIGAINDQLYRCPSLNVKAIDLNARLPFIEQCNFLDLPVTIEYDLVVCSMVDIIFLFAC
jgi:hypothetical protein